MNWFTRKTEVAEPAIPVIDPEEARQTANRIYGKGCNCAQAVVGAFAELGALPGFDPTTLSMLAKGFGNGLGGQKGNCGALAGAIMVISGVFTSRGGVHRSISKISRAFTDRFLEQFGELTCASLKKDSHLTCRQKTIETAALLAEFLNEHAK